MKKILSAILIVSIVCLTAGCSAGKKNTGSDNAGLTEVFTDKGKSISALFGDDYSYSKILDELSGISLNAKPDYNKYTEKVETDEQSSTSVKKYYDGSLLVYEVPEGYGEKGFIFHTKTKNMKDVKASYWLEDDKIYTVDIAGEGFVVSYNNLDDSKPYGANQINVTVNKAVDGEIPFSASYTISNSKVSLSNAIYFADGIYKSYSCQVDESGKADENEEVKFDLCKTEPNVEVFRQISDDTAHSDVQTIIGKHKLSFNVEGSKKNWFITMDLYVLFDDEDAALDYIVDNGIGSNENVTYGNDYVVKDNYYVLYKDVTFAIDDRFIVNGEQSFKDFAVDEFDDYIFSKVVFSSKGDILAFESDNDVMRYYQ